MCLLFRGRLTVRQSYTRRAVKLNQIKISITAGENRRKKKAMSIIKTITLKCVTKITLTLKNLKKRNYNSTFEPSNQLITI